MRTTRSHSPMATPLQEYRRQLSSDGPERPASTQTEYPTRVPAAEAADVGASYTDLFGDPGGDHVTVAGQARISRGSRYRDLHVHLPGLARSYDQASAATAGTSCLCAYCPRISGYYETMVRSLLWSFKKSLLLRETFLGRSFLEGSWVGHHKNDG